MKGKILWGSVVVAALVTGIFSYLVSQNESKSKLDVVLTPLAVVMQITETAEARQTGNAGQLTSTLNRTPSSTSTWTPFPISIVTPKANPSSTLILPTDVQPTRTYTPIPVPTPWFGFVSLRWEPQQPHWGNNVVFYAKFNNTLPNEQYLSWRIEICKTDCTDWTKLMYQTDKKVDFVPSGGMFEVVSTVWPLRGPGPVLTYPVRFVHDSGATRIGEKIYYITISPQ